jgi:hypothetical protein
MYAWAVTLQIFVFLFQMFWSGQVYYFLEQDQVHFVAALVYPVKLFLAGIGD